jgi:hypothetical protein
MDLDYDNIMDHVIDLLMTNGLCNPSNVHGCSQQEIMAVADSVGKSLPKSYVSFLSRMGRGAGRLYRGSHHFYPSILGLNHDAEVLVAEDKSGINLPSDAIVFSMHQGYQFLFMRASEGDDPPVYYYCEQSGAFKRTDDSFTAYLKSIACDKWGS